jgi:hypothetical protein
MVRLALRRAFGLALVVAAVQIGVVPPARTADTDAGPAPSAGTSKADLGDTGAPPPSDEDLGKTAEPPADAPPPPADATTPPEPPKARRPASATDDGERDPAAVGAVPPDGQASQRPRTTGTPTSTKAPGPPGADQSAKAAKLATDLQAALLAEPGDARLLEGFSQTAGIEALIAIEPTIRPLVRLARARAFLLQGRLDDAQTALSDARAAADGTSGIKGRRVAAQVRFRLGELEEARLRQRQICGVELGLARLASFEGKRVQEATKKVAARYKTAAQSGDRFWARRAAFRTALLYESHYREAIKATSSYRATKLPSPLAFGKVSTDEILKDIATGPWPNEIARLYSSIIGSVDARDPDPQLIEAARKAAAQLGRLTPAAGETAENPMLSSERTGLIRFTSRRFEQRDAKGGWRTIEARDARRLMASVLDAATARGGDPAVNGQTDVVFVYALVGLAEAGPEPSPALVLAALASKDPITRLAGAIAAEKAPLGAYAEPLIALYLASSADVKKNAFSTLQGALYGEAERVLLALRAAAKKDRAVGEKLLADTRLPAAERAWIVAEVGDARLSPGLQALVYQDDVTAARAVFGLYLAQGRNGLGFARPNAEGYMGCVSKAVQEMGTTGAR